VQSFGEHNPGETFLVADMGGSTLDIAFFTIEPNHKIHMYQVGAVRFAAENYLKALVERSEPDFERQEIMRWQIRDSIMAGKSLSDYGDQPEAYSILKKFYGLAFEFLRTLVLAHRQREPDQQIHLILVGNGWNLVENYLSDGQTRVMDFMQYYDELLRQLGESHLSRYTDEMLLQLPSSKHLVALGAMKNAMEMKRQELTEPANQVMLAAGRSLEFRSPRKKIRWFDLVGDRMMFEGTSRDEIVGGGLDFYLNDLPTLSDSWRAFLLNIFEVSDEWSIPYPSENHLRSQIYKAIQGNPPSVTRGPLQVILEEHWIKVLNS
jgi:hypothetical protein